MRRHPLCVVVLSLTLLAGAARADDGHDRAREALDRGEIVPLDRILAEVGRRGLGTVIEIELEREDGRWVYEVETLSEDGVISRVWIDAKNPHLPLLDGKDEDD